MLEEKYTIGRDVKKNLILYDLSVSKNHAVIHQSDSRISVEDLASTNGTYINTGIDHNESIEKNKRIDLKAGDRVRFGMSHVYRLENIPDTVISSDEIIDIPEKNLSFNFTSFHFISFRILVVLTL